MTLTMPDYPWYEIVNDGDKLLQGDLIDNCFIVYPNDAVFRDIVQEKPTGVSSVVDVKQCHIIVLSQSCDIDNDKIDSLIVCPRWSLLELIKADQHFKSTSAREELRQGKLPAYHLLNKCDTQDQKLPYSVVDFHRIYSIPKDFLKQIALKANPRLRLLPPYREHLAQSFARYFMRVGLPVDINKIEIQNIT